jgi:hypothetical protein
MSTLQAADRNGQEEIGRRIRLLNSLVDGQQASVELASFGAAAIEPLKDFLFNGPPSGIFQPRQWAVEALAAIGAKEVLMAYLAREDRIPDPVIRLGEDAVRNTAARLMTRWKSDDVFQLLLTLALKRVLPGLITALGQFDREDALPVLERALEDDVARPPAQEALEQFGDRAIPILVASTRRKRLIEEQEVPSSLQRRRVAAQILSESRIGAEGWPGLKALLDEDDAELVIHAAKLADKLAPASDKKYAIGALLRVLPQTPWYVREEAAECLVAFYHLGEAMIEDEIARLSKDSQRKRGIDNDLLTLQRVRRQLVGRGKEDVK